uniref:C2H2-type domain-containing protein n=1 Tax=Timema tahoe TaxID=61484 RepID=A0A7R9NXP4_9NEOP|nr:unnamed protein product [Timema tahoe]
MVKGITLAIDWTANDEIGNKNEDSTCLPRLIESELTKPDTNDIEHPEENENNVSILSFVEVILDEGISHIGLNGREEIKTSDHSEREECLDVTKFSPSVSKRKRDRLKFRFQCNDCPKCYKFKYEIKNHAMKHTGERPFKCTFCDYKFRYSSHLTIHLKIHQGLRDFVCSECDYMYTVECSHSSEIITTYSIYRITPELAQIWKSDLIV